MQLRSCFINLFPDKYTLLCLLYYANTNIPFYIQFKLENSDINRISHFSCSKIRRWNSHVFVSFIFDVAVLIKGHTKLPLQSHVGYPCSDRLCNVLLVCNHIYLYICIMFLCITTDWSSYLYRLTEVGFVKVFLVYLFVNLPLQITLTNLTLYITVVVQN